MRHAAATPRRFVLVVVTVVVAAAWFAWLRPATLGGDVSYVIVQGSSMEPTYDDGDLVVVRKEGSYDVGDIVTFRAGGTFDDPTRIIHRIVGETSDGTYITQGDNRDRTDPWQPDAEGVIGRAVVHVPMAGDVFNFLAQPAALGALGGAAVVLGGQRRRRRRRMTRLPSRPGDDVVPERRRDRVAASLKQRRLSPRRPGLTPTRWAVGGLVATGVLAVPVLALAWSALKAPDTNVHIEQIGEVDYGVGTDYRFTGTPSAVYPTGVVEAERNAAGILAPHGPLYNRLLDRLDVTLAFRTAERGASVRSTYAFDVAVETPAGWSSTLQTAAPERFSGTATETVTVDLRAVEAKVASVGELTGVGGDAYAITVTPRLDVEGSAEGITVRDELSPPLTFAVERNLITVQALDETSGTKELQRSVTEPATYAAGPLKLSTQTARAVLAGLALMVVGAAVWFASVVFGGFGLREPARIAARYRSRIIDVDDASAPPGPVVLVSGIDELARIARVEQSVILHEDLGHGGHRYRVFLGAVTYEYETAPEHGGAATEQVASPGPGG